MDTIVALVKTMRPKQWAKNVFVLAALVFDAKLFMPSFLARAFAAFCLFCAISSAVYLINDVADMEKDRQHPGKRNRPLASGQLSPNIAVMTAVVIVAVALPLAYLLDPAFAAIAFGYLAILTLYSFRLKNIVILDVIIVATGFVMVFGALFIAISKRRHELVLLNDNANAHRRIFSEYSLALLDEMTRLVTACTAMAYSLYTFSAPNLPQSHAMMLTIPFVLYGLFRYMYLVHIRGEGGAPEDLVFEDKPLLLAIILWGLTVVGILYFL